MTIGRDSSFYSNLRFEIGETAILSIGHHFTASYGCVIACNSKISVGDHVMIGEYTSVRDTSHSYGDPSKPFIKQSDYSEPILIGSNVWIVRGCVLLPGTTIQDNVIIGANSVVKGSVDSNGIYAGAPLKKIKALT
jgi:acetyltransferase-like isoleucine patch superfamily enzyme